MPVKELEIEIKYFREHKEDLLEKNPGKFALIKAEACVGTYDSADNAYDEGVRLFGNEAFLIQEILPEEPIQDLPAHYLGILHALN